MNSCSACWYVIELTAFSNSTPAAAKGYPSPPFAVKSIVVSEKLRAPPTTSPSCTSTVPSSSTMLTTRSPEARVVSYTTRMPDTCAKRPSAAPLGDDRATECSMMVFSCSAFTLGAVLTRLVKGSTLNVSPTVTLPALIEVRMPPPFWIAMSVPPAWRIASATTLPRLVSALRTPAWKLPGVPAAPRAPFSETADWPITVAFSTSM
jgi:hypothetical protein